MMMPVEELHNGSKEASQIKEKVGISKKKQTKWWKNLATSSCCGFFSNKDERYEGIELGVEVNPEAMRNEQSIKSA